MDMRGQGRIVNQGEMTDIQVWKSYEYFAGGHNYWKAIFAPDGGPDGRPCLWVDDSMWTIDTPEQPQSILFLLNYRRWDGLPPVDLRGAELRFRLRGDDLILHGARCHFWAVANMQTATRWRLTGIDIPISHGEWGAEVVLPITAEPSLWHRSFASARDQAGTANLTEALSLCVSYGFAFVGFSEKVTGRVGLADFRLRLDSDPGWPYFLNSRDGTLADWLTVSRERGVQLPIASQERLAAGKSALAGGSGPGIYVRDDFMVIDAPINFSYLAFLRAEVVGRRDLRNALLILRHDARAFDPREGKIQFFVEHAASATRWLFRVDLAQGDTSLFYEMLVADPVFWRRLSGSLSLDDVLAGGEGGTGYDYLGFMLVGPQGTPRGVYGLTSFSIGPTADPRWAAKLP